MQRIDIVYKAADYLRLSKEDGDFSVSPQKQESNSISSQRDLIRQFVSKSPDIQLVAEFCDDGYTGTNFDRPDFKKMMDAVKAGEINCIIVKDLSRFGRDYIESGRYIEKIFPQMGVRFIAINDHFDSALSNSNDNIILPFKNLINDSYSRDISVKVRTNLESKRRRGEFIANFAVYGYARDPQDKNKLVVDECAAAVVRDIYRWRIEGISAQKIAVRLNEHGVLSPMEYKQSNGSNYTTKFKTGYQANWSAVAVARILTNPVYTGTLVQGRRTTPNYKVKNPIQKDESEWARIENAHEAIIRMTEFNLVQELQRTPTRSGAGAENAYALSGKVFCAGCGKPVKRLSACSDGRKYAYYNCPDATTRPTRRNGHLVSSGNQDGCQSCRISEKELESAVLATLQAQIGVILDMDQALAQADTLAWENREYNRLEARILAQKEIIEKNKRLHAGIYEDLVDGLISKEEYNNLKQQFSLRIREAEEITARLNRECSDVKESLATQQDWLAQFREYRNLTSLTRSVIVHLVARITLYPDKKIELSLRHKDQFAGIIEFLGTLNHQSLLQEPALTLNTKEAV